MTRGDTYHVGDVVGNAELIEKVSQNKHRTWQWRWKCLSCGAISGPSVMQKIVQSDRCHKCYNYGPRNQNWLGHEELTGSWLYQYRSDAVKKGRAWGVTPEDLWAQWVSQKGRCAYTGWALTHGVDASLDRIDSTEGYLPDNVQWVHRDINRMKSNFTDPHFRRLCVAVATPRRESHRPHEEMVPRIWAVGE